MNMVIGGKEWRAVPVEPTQEMLDAGEETAISSYTGTPVVTPGGAWAAMLRAAPPPPATASGGAEVVEVARDVVQSAIDDLRALSTSAPRSSWDEVVAKHLVAAIRRLASPQDHDGVRDAAPAGEADIPAGDASGDVDVALREMQSAIFDLMVPDAHRERLRQGLDALICAWVDKSRALAGTSAPVRHEDAGADKAINQFLRHAPTTALGWFDRLTDAIRNQDKCVLARDELGVETWRCVAASSSMVIAREHADEIRTALGKNSPTDKAGAAVGGRDDWRPIETAPKDGTEILVAHEGFVYAARWTDEGWYEVNVDSSDVYGDAIYPTHWRPLPDPPPTDDPVKSWDGGER